MAPPGDRQPGDRQPGDRQTDVHKTEHLQPYRAPGDRGADQERPALGRSRGDLVRTLLLLGLSAALLGLAWTLLVRDGGGTDRVAATPPSVAQTPAALSTAPVPAPAATPDEPVAAAPRAAVPRAPAADAPLPAGWTTYRSPDGSFTLGLPPEWTPVGDPAEQRFISSSRLTTVSVRSAEAGPNPEPALLETDETEFAARNAGYKRLAAETTEHRGSPARTVDYTSGAGAQARRGSDLGVLVGDRAYWLKVESKATSWRFAEPLVKRFRGTFVPA